MGQDQAANSPDSIANIIARTTSGLRVSTQHRAGTPLPGTLRMSQQSRVEPWTEILKPGEDYPTKWMVFKSTQLATFAQEGVIEAVNSKVHIRVGLADVDMDAIREKHGPVIVEQILRARNMLISSIQYLPVLTQILTATTLAKIGRSSISTINRRLLLRNSNSCSSTIVFVWKQTRLLRRTLVSLGCFVTDLLVTVRFLATPTLTITLCETFPSLPACKKVISSPIQTWPCKW